MPLENSHSHILARLSSTSLPKFQDVDALSLLPWVTASKKSDVPDSPGGAREVEVGVQQGVSQWL